MNTDFLRHENEDIGHFIQCQAIFVCPSNGRCQDCKVYQSLFVFTVDVGIQLFCPISATYQTNIGPTEGYFHFWRCTCGLFWPHTTLAHLTSQAKSSEENCRSSLVYQRDNFLLILWGCLGENVEDQWGKCWSSRHHPENHLWRGTVCCGTAWYGIVWSSQKIIFDVV